MLMAGPNYDSGNITAQLTNNTKAAKPPAPIVSRVQIGIWLNGVNLVDFGIDHWPPVNNLGSFTYFNGTGVLRAIASSLHVGSYQRLTGQDDPDTLGFNLTPHYIQLHGLVRNFSLGSGSGNFWLYKSDYAFKIPGTSIGWKIESKNLREINPADASGSSPGRVHPGRPASPAVSPTPVDPGSPGLT